MDALELERERSLRNLRRGLSSPGNSLRASSERLYVAGVKPEEIVISEAQAHPHRSYASPNAQAEVLMNAIRDAVKRDLIRSV